MTPHGSYLLVLIVQTCVVYGQEEIIKSSLTFVIDDTASMTEEIEQVKAEANIILDKVLSTNTSQIENFVLVTFNDHASPTDIATKLWTVTRDASELRRSLSGVHTWNIDNYSCPERALAGIELGLTESLPLSYLYVFTDASAIDYARYEEIKSIALKKQSQIVFLLTGECDHWLGGLGLDGPDHQVYNLLAEATGGQVFHMFKSDVKDILKYVEESITGRAIPLVNKKLAPGYDKSVKYPVDPHTGPVLISITGLEPKIGDVTGPDGSKPATEPIVSGKPRMEIVKVKDAKPGDHEVKLGSKSETHVVITAKSDINFQLGFSVYRPASMKDTVTRPAQEGNVFLGITLLGSGVKLTTAKILDLSDNVITELPLELVDEKVQFYLTPSFNPPFTMFRVSVSGLDVGTKSPISRTSPIPILRQDPNTVTKVNKAPEITIEGAPKVIAEYGAPLQLKCNVHGYPAPAVTWQEKDTALSLPAKVELKDVPYDYIGILDIDKANKNVTYQCTASNSMGVNTKFVEVEMKTFFDVIEPPKDTGVEYSKEGSLVCKVNANPPASITWYKDGALISGDSDTVLSGDKSLLTIQHMSLHSQGTYMCEARNDIQRKVFIVEVTIFGVEKPVIDKSHEELRVPEKTSAELSCRILKGIPKPNITWSYRAAGESTYTHMRDTTESIRVTHASRQSAGSYKCVAQNDLGTDSFTMELVVEYPPKIEEDVKEIKCIDDDEVRIPCDVTGEPAPTVRWYYNGTKLHLTAKIYDSSDHSLRFKARIADAGAYRCVAENKLGTVKKAAFLYVYIPVTIETPKMSTIETMVGKSTLLNCRADGYPKPSIKWTFHSLDPNIPAEDVTPSGGAASVPLKNIQLNQEGSYTCVAATDIGGSANITYDVKVRAPPVIKNTYTRRNFDALEGDLALRIRCNATGSPKPSIVWTKYGLNSTIGSEWHDVEEDGTLVIKNIDRQSAGTYVCLAQNVMGNDTEVYEVTVRDSPAPEWHPRTVFVEEGKTINITCDVPHKSTDQLRWYKNGVAISAVELTLYSVTRSDDGLYTCRVSGHDKSYSGTTKVVVGFKPEFTSEEPDTVEFVLGADTELLPCEAYGEPRPETASWKHNGAPLGTTSMSHPLGMVLGATGTYECEVSNMYGSIHRTFKVTSRDCILDIKKDFPEKQPIMYSPSLGWPVFPVEDGFMIIPHHDYFFFNCPSLFSDESLPYTSNIMAFCERDNKVKINGRIYNFADIKCNSDAVPDVSPTGVACLPGNTEYIKVGYRIHNVLLEVYDVCLDKDKSVPLFTKHKLSSDCTDRPGEAPWSSSQLSLDFASLYECRRQAVRSESCCFARRQLVSARDLLAGVPTSAVYDYLNVVPHWSSCNTKNWEEVEDRVRTLAKVAGRDLIISTGTASPGHDRSTNILLQDGRGGNQPVAQYLWKNWEEVEDRVRTLAKVAGRDLIISTGTASPGHDRSTNILLQDGRGGNQPVAQYLWKVVQDPMTSSSLAIIQVNIPELSRAQAGEHVLCPNICQDDTIVWMKNSNWDNVEDGFTYCCSILKFETAFGYRGRFSPGMKYVLFDGSRMPDLSLATE